MTQVALIDTLRFVLLVSALTVLPFVFLVLGVMVLKRLMSRKNHSSIGKGE